MRALLLAAGYGTRLQPLTNTIPKCLVPIKGKALLDIWLENLDFYGFGSFVVNTHYLREKVENHIKQSTFRDKVTLVYEQELQGTAGTILNNIEFFREHDLLLAHADNYCFPNFTEFKAAHDNRPSECLMTMMIFHTDTPSTCGIVELDSNGVVVDFHEKVTSPPGNLANGAVYILSEEFIKIIKDDFYSCNDFSTEILPSFMGKIFTYKHNGIFLDIGTPETYKLANL